MYISYNKLGYKHELVRTNSDISPLNFNIRKPSKASIILGTMDTVDLQEVRPSSSGHFNPRSPRYQVCGCAHVKTVTIVAGIIEIFVVCFLIVAILPDLGSKLCSQTKEDIAIEQLLGSENFTAGQNSFGFMSNNRTNASIILMHIGLDTVQQVSCSIGIGWIFWAFVHIVSVNVLFYGCKKKKWKFFMPHLLIRFALIVVLVLLTALLAIIIFNPITSEEAKPTLFIIGIAAVIFALLLLILTIIEIRCCEFAKKSADTGFSTTIARSIGVPTISSSDNRNHPHHIIPQIDQINIIKEEEEETSQPITLPAISPIHNGAHAYRRRSSAFSENPLNLRNLPPLRHTYRPG